jgi:hypothetical protein
VGSNTAADHITVLQAALQQLPAYQRQMRMRIPPDALAVVPV